jgi:cytoskeletal protein RodZ
MSQEKVNRYKAEKANRYTNLKKAKRKKAMTKASLILLAIVIIAAIGTAIGFSAYNKYQSYVASLPDYTSTSKVISDMAGILETEEETEDGTQAEDESNAAGVEQTEASSESVTEGTQTADTTADTTQSSSN